MTTPHSIDEALTAYRRFIESEPSPTRENFMRQEELREATGAEPPQIIAQRGKEEQQALTHTFYKYFRPLEKKLRHQTVNVVVDEDGRTIYAATPYDIFNVNQQRSVLDCEGESFVGLGKLNGKIWLARQNGEVEALHRSSTPPEGFKPWRNGDDLDAAGMIDERFIVLTKTRRGYNLTDAVELTPVESNVLSQTTDWLRTFAYQGYPFLITANDRVSVTPEQAFGHTEFYRQIMGGSHD